MLDMGALVAFLFSWSAEEQWLIAVAVVALLLVLLLLLAVEVAAVRPVAAAAAHSFLVLHLIPYLPRSQSPPCCKSINQPLKNVYLFIYLRGYFSD
jgi:predicted branched-subunit amino acid permease